MLTLLTIVNRARVSKLKGIARMRSMGRTTALITPRTSAK